MLTATSPAISTIVRKALPTGKLRGVKPSVLGAVRSVVGDAQSLLEAFRTIAKLVSPIGKRAGRKPRKHGAARVVVQTAKKR